MRSNLKLKNEEMKKRLFYCLWALIALMSVFISCNNEDDPEIGRGKNPQLNLEKYAFPKEGGSLEIYSTLDYELYVIPNSDVSYEETNHSFIGSWFEVTWDATKKKIQIKVQQNETGKERKIPINVWSGNFRCTTDYTQKAE